MIDRRPALIARCAGTADVVEAVRFAKEHALLNSVKAGGHNIAGQAICEDGLDDENFAAAVNATGRKKLIVAGVTNDVCTVFPALSLVREAYEVQVVADAGGSPSKMSDDIALRRMERGGVTLTSTNQVIAELAGNWTTPEGGQLVQVVMEALQA